MEGQDEVSAREQHFHSQVRESTVRGRAVPWCCAARWTQERSADQHGPIASSRTPSRTPAFQRPTGSAADRFRLRPLSPATRSPAPHLLTSATSLPVTLLSSPLIGLPRATSALSPPFCPLYLCSLPSPSLSRSRHLYTPPIPVSPFRRVPMVTCAPPFPRAASYHLCPRPVTCAHFPFTCSRLFSHHWQPFPSSSPPSRSTPSHLHLTHAHFS